MVSDQGTLYDRHLKISDNLSGSNAMAAVNRPSRKFLECGPQPCRVGGSQFHMGGCGGAIQVGWRLGSLHVLQRLHSEVQLCSSRKDSLAA